MVAVAPPVAPELVKALDSEPSLERENLSDAGGLWRLLEPPAHVPAQPESALHRPWLWTQAALVLLVSVLAAPGRREPTPERVEAPAPAALVSV